MDNSTIGNEKLYQDHRSGRALTGLLLLIVGGVLLASKMGAPIPRWLMSWEMFLIVLGRIIGIKHRFRNPGWLVPVFIGALSLADDFYPTLNIKTYIWPAVIMLLGLLFLIKPKRKWKFEKRLEARFAHEQYTRMQTSESSEEVLDITAAFGGVKRTILSKNFQGGDITAFMGGAELDLTQADIQGTTELDITAVLGGVKLVIPSHWDVQNKATAVFGGVDDKRITPVVTDKDKVLVIHGAAVFGGIEIRSYRLADK